MFHPSRPLRILLTALVLGLLFPASAPGWGGDVHRLLNEAACQALPYSFRAFTQWEGDLVDLSTDADRRKRFDSDESMRHYIDIDRYPAFFSGTLPHGWDQMIQSYGTYTVEDNGILPWAIEASLQTLTEQFALGDWLGAVKTAADVGHYVGDLHQPLHLTENFDGQLTGQDGIHSRFESDMTARHLSELVPYPEQADVVQDPMESVFDWIGSQYLGMEEILDADTAAQEAAGNDWSDAYYNALWSEVGTQTRGWIAAASVRIASLWYTAWVNAGSPPLPGSVSVEPTTWGRLKALYGN